jgi:HSP20 family protein
MPGLFSPNWFEQVVNELNSAQIYNTDSSYPYNIILNKDESDTPKEYIIEIALAGINKENISVKVREGILIINVHKPEEVVDNKKQYLRQGISQKKSSTKFSLSKDVDGRNITSTFVDGLLQVIVPCTQPETQNIDINVD